MHILEYIFSGHSFQQVKYMSKQFKQDVAIN
jgi:hypothetical protein